jgi:hypothetical protein
MPAAALVRGRHCELVARSEQGRLNNAHHAMRADIRWTTMPQQFPRSF